jgi:hypothetical protein
MKSRNYFLPALLAGFAASVLLSVPVLKNLSCCFLIPFASVFALWLYKNSSRTDYIEFKDAALTGLLTGIFMAIFSTTIEIFLTFISHTNDFVESLPQTEIALKNLEIGPILDNTFSIMKQMSKEIQENGFSLFYSIGIFFSNLFVDTLFAFLGAIAGRVYFNRRSAQE